MAYLAVVVVCIMTTPGQISKKPIGPFVACSKYIIRVSCVPRGSSNAAFARDEAFYALSDAVLRANGPPTQWKTDGEKGREREGEREREKRSTGRRAISCRNIRRRKFRYQATIRYLFVAMTSSEN